MFHESFKEVEVSRIFHDFQGCSGSVSKVFKKVSRKLSGCFKKVSCCMVAIVAARAEGGLVMIGSAQRKRTSQYRIYFVCLIHPQFILLTPLLTACEAQPVCI